MTNRNWSPIIAAVTTLTLLFCFGHGCAALQSYNVTIDTKNSNFSTDLKFVSFAVGVRTLVRTEGRNAQFKIDDPKMVTLAKAVAPCSIRVGGTYSNFMIFDANGSSPAVPQYVKTQWERTFNGQFWGTNVGSKNWENTKFTGDQWSRWTNFTQSVGWDLIFDVNQLLQYQDTWDPTNFKSLLNYSKQKGIQIAGFQLGNEPNAYSHKFGLDKTTASMAEDYKKFKKVLQEYPEYNSSLIVGPDPTSLARNRRAAGFLEDFLKAGGSNSLGAIGLHHYYFDGDKSTLENFLDPTIMDSFKILTQSATEIRDRQAPGTPIYMTETADAFGGGSPKYSTTFVATFIYMDEMALSAKYGLGRFHRQTFNSGNYALVSSDTLEPHPNYYLALLFKRLIYGPVLNVDFTPTNQHLRLYAHCARRDIYPFPRASIVVYYANLENKEQVLDFTQNYNVTRGLDVFILTSDDPQNLDSPLMKLNGQTLKWNGTELPDLSPVRVQGPVTVPAHSLGFIVLNKVRGSICRRV